METSYQPIALHQIRSSPYQARKEFNDEALHELAESMRHEGLIEPIIVREVDGQYELISGERRVRAAKLLGWEKIDSKIIVTVSEAEAVAKGLIENIQRQNLSPIEEAEGFLILNQLDKRYWTQEKIAEVAGKTQTYVSRSMALLELPRPIIQNMRARIFSRSHGLELLRLANPEQQLEVAEQIPGRLTWQETRQVVDTYLVGKNKSKLKNKKSNQGLDGNFIKDPLGNFWPAFMMRPEVNFSGSWWADYEVRSVGYPARKENGWNFFVTVAPDQDNLTELKSWFRKMADALDHPQPATFKSPRQAQSETEKFMKDLSQWLPSNPAEAEKAQQEEGKVRLPANAEEQAELESLAAQGPGPMYAWLWGPESYIAKKTRTSSWVELGFDDPLLACRSIVASCRSQKVGKN